MLITSFDHKPTNIEWDFAEEVLRRHYPGHRLKWRSDIESFIIYNAKYKTVWQMPWEVISDYLRQ